MCAVPQEFPVAAPKLTLLVKSSDVDFLLAFGTTKLLIVVFASSVGGGGGKFPMGLVF